MATTAFTVAGNDTVEIDSTLILGFAGADNFTLTFPNEIMGMTKGKNGNAIFSNNVQGTIGEIEMRLIRTTDSNIFLLNKLNTQLKDLPTFVLMNLIYVKRLGDGLGNVKRDVYNCTGGLFTKKVDIKENLEGDTEQNIAVWNMRFTDIEISFS
ncbi:MAG: hypothetical protein V3W20_02280 [Candidatus Neomarinimicrobiota bacterium]